ncbi:MAG: methylated-DNA--[protein]-cysteine S-methyltransferase [Steroidobacteraceae bacterium]
MDAIAHRATTAYALFATPLGRCAIAWNERGICAVQLPEASLAASRARLQRRFPNALARTPPPDMRRAITAMVKLLNGEASDLARLSLDYNGVSEFSRRVCEAARAIPAGTTRTYGELAAQLGKPGAARAVGAVMAGNLFPIIVPCHRVLAAGGRPGGFSAHGGLNTKMRMLRIEAAIAA